MVNTLYAVAPHSKSGVINKDTGRCIGSIGNHGYWQVRASRSDKLRLAHRVIWELTYGPIPEGMEVDHINRVRSDNRLENLRLVSSAENSWNTSGHSDSVVGIKNISKHQNGYMVEVMRNGVRYRRHARTVPDALIIKEEILNELEK